MISGGVAGRWDRPGRGHPWSVHTAIISAGRGRACCALLQAGARRAALPSAAELRARGGGPEGRDLLMHRLAPHLVEPVQFMYR
ncbi:hypothetical protein QJS66_04110 [Kocuria rhizophila]|nr:hypothetical protein QJS66_04110 [Kocuria rhizophila]